MTIPQKKKNEYKRILFSLKVGVGFTLGLTYTSIALGTPSYSDHNPSEGNNTNESYREAGPVEFQADTSFVSEERSNEEILFLYSTSALYGVTSGIWIDTIAPIRDPGLAMLTPIGLGILFPTAFYLWDSLDPFARGVPSSIGTGLLLGAGTAIGILMTQSQHAGSRYQPWSISTQFTVTMASTTVGGIAGYAFGQATHPSPASLTFIGSGGGWGGITGALLGAGLTSIQGDWKEGATLGGLIGYTTGFLTTGALSSVYKPSPSAQNWMWIGYGSGALATSFIYIVYLCQGTHAGYGLVTNAAGGMGGLVLASLLTSHLQETSSAPPPVQISKKKLPLGVGFLPAGNGGGLFTLSGIF
ncbi:hypothetical protein [Pajaroellobacter abortibovis]|uniref:Uncharacterized protein n=1 Tax=Pajaroellobacter abortibovis TaxID=1882918 RepID=A0A1L6MVC5_9BACT|nr:hypothetical protein [Pajaroellobacter abortibovis]APR99431.1 hypothetical protein BCY86_01085 [Pajaroellobacter abortibovis]